MESAKLNALRYRSRRYHPTHLRANTRINDINPPEQHRALWLRMLIGKASAKRTLLQVVEIIRARSTGAVGATSAARIRAFRDFLSQGEVSHPRAEQARQVLKSWLGAFRELPNSVTAPSSARMTTKCKSADRKRGTSPHTVNTTPARMTLAPFPPMVSTTYVGRALANVLRNGMWQRAHCNC